MPVRLSRIYVLMQLHIYWYYNVVIVSQTYKNALHKNVVKAHNKQIDAMTQQ